MDRSERNMGWALKTLKRKDITREELESLYKKHSQIELCTILKIDKKVLIDLLRILNVKCDKNEKMRAAQKRITKTKTNNIKKFHENNIAKFNHNDYEVKKNLELYGIKFCSNTLYNSSFIESYVFLNGHEIILPHNSTIKANINLLRIEELYSDILNFFQKDSQSIAEIATNLNLPLTILKRVIKKRNPEIIQEDIQRNRKNGVEKLIQNNRVKKENKTKELNNELDKYNSEIQNLLFIELESPRVIAESYGWNRTRLYQYVIDEFSIDLTNGELNNQRMWVKKFIKNNNFKLNHAYHLFFKNRIIVPKLFSQYEDLYYQYILNTETKMINDFCKEFKITNFKELCKIFTTLNYSSIVIRHKNAIFYSQTMDEKILRKINTGHYHFITTGQFINDVKQRKFKNYHELKKFYGLNSGIIEAFQYGEYTPNFIHSTEESKISKILIDHKIPYQINNRKVLGSGMELDFYMKEFNFAMEVSPDYTHNSNKNGNTFIKPLPKEYHKIKWTQASQNNINLIQLHSIDLKPQILDNFVTPLILEIIGIEKHITILPNNIIVKKFNGIDLIVKEFYNSMGKIAISNEKYLMFYHNNNIIFATRYIKEWDYVILSDLCYNAKLITHKNCMSLMFQLLYKNPEFTGKDFLYIANNDYEFNSSFHKDYFKFEMVLPPRLYMYSKNTKNKHHVSDSNRNAIEFLEYEWEDNGVNNLDDDTHYSVYNSGETLYRFWS